MKKSILALFAISMTMFAAGETKKVHEKTAKLQKDSYCNVPKEFGEFKKINTKDSRVDVNFEKCVFDGETYENVKVGVLVQDTKKAEKFLKKYKYMHLKAGKNLIYNSDDNSYYYTGSWAFNNDKAYPTVFDGK
ncbi:MarR family transcriptional regulator [Leptotrichia wadei]|uniref:MarR family transcriptional regulator n=1 Tax=Leptotrichia wadei TaxID=157687 RepID=UPI0028D60B40|nr:MarR family transcriptional regulator [Leptotrichia wadei]